MNDSLRGFVACRRMKSVTLPELPAVVGCACALSYAILLKQARRRRLCCWFGGFLESSSAVFG